MTNEQEINWAKSTLMSFGFYFLESITEEELISKAKDINNKFNRELEKGRKLGISDSVLISSFANKIH